MIGREQALAELVREAVRVELRRGPLAVSGITGRGGNTSVTSDGDIHITTKGAHKAYYNGTEIGSGSGTITGSGIAGQLAKFTAGTTLGNSLLSDDGSNVSTSTDILFKGAAKSKYYNVSNTLVGNVFGTSYTSEGTTYNGLQLQPQNMVGTTPGNLYIGDYASAPAGNGIKVTDAGISIYPRSGYKVGFNHAELEDFRLENLSTGALPNGGIGGLAYDTTVNSVKVNKGAVGTPNWVEVGGTAKVSSNDTTPGYLNGKLVAGTGITLTEGSDGGNETLTIANSGAGTGDVLANATRNLNRLVKWTNTTTKEIGNSSITDDGINPITIGNTTVPYNSSSYDLGSSSYYWKDLYLSGKAIIGAADVYLEHSVGNLNLCTGSAWRLAATDTSVDVSQKLRIHTNGYTGGGSYIVSDVNGAMELHVPSGQALKVVVG